MGLLESIRSVVSSVLSVPGLGTPASLIRRTSGYSATEGVSVVDAPVTYPVKVGPSEKDDLAEGFSKATSGKKYILYSPDVVPNPATDLLEVFGVTLGFSVLETLALANGTVAYYVTLGK